MQVSRKAQQTRGGAVRPSGGEGRKIGVALGATAAALASAGLVFWVGAGPDRAVSGRDTTTSAPEAPVAFAARRPNADQVIRAFEQLQDTYAEQGLNGVMRFARSCADELKNDPSMLDFCIAFDIYASALQDDEPATRAWQAEAGARDLALARNALAPDQDAAARLAAIGELARLASVEAPGLSAPTQAQASAPAPALTRTRAKPASPHHRPQAHVATKVHAKSKAHIQAKTRATDEASNRVAGAHVERRASAPARTCGHNATPLQRLLCESPALRDSDQRMQRAYRRALSAGVERRGLARDQARWRESVNAAAPDWLDVAQLYHRRTEALEQLANDRRAGSD